MLKTGVNNSIWARGEFMNTAHEQNLSPEAQGALPGEQVAISIIIPVYNVVAWLPRAVDSLTAQTFSDFEILLVDDGSTDGSAELADKLALLDSRIRVIHQNNAGAAAARNTAIEVARGEFLYFMDGDTGVNRTCSRACMQLRMKTSSTCW